MKQTKSETDKNYIASMQKLDKCDDFNVHMNYSPLRESLFSWFEFDNRATVLELNAQSGALTGLFARRCKSVTAITSCEKKDIVSKRYEEQENVVVLSAEEFDKTRQGKYDYIIAYHTLSDLNENILSVWMDMLNKEGHLFIVAENRYGIKYFCGAKDPYTGICYDGINNYLHRSFDEGRCYSKKQIETLLESNKIDNYKFYYPVPDSSMPQMIFSDNYMKGTNSFERLIDYNYIDDSIVGLEHRIFGELIDGGALPFMSNSFLVDIAKGEVSDIDYAVLTTDRGEKSGCATTIHSGKIVKKRPLWKQGEDNIKRLYENTEDLINHGVPVIKAKLKEDEYGTYLSMPYCEGPALSDVIKDLIVSDKEKVFEIFDSIYNYIYTASEVIDKDECGDILSKGYLDLAPCNSFYEQDGILFYDQEFVMEKCPLKYAMFRTIKYCYASAKMMEEHISIKTMYERYGISDELIDKFEKKETEFITGLRNTEVYKPMYKWATPDYEKLYRRMKKITKLSEKSDKPYKIGYVPGVYDLFHVGHLRLFERCKERCDYLIVGVLTDELVEYYKAKRPVISYENRAAVIEGLKVVDEVIPVDFNNTDKLKAWEQLHYDCHFSGDDHVGHWDDIIEELRKRGSNMEFFSYTEGISSTAIRNKMQD